MLPLNPPAFPVVRWPLPAKLVPQVQDVAKGLYQAAYFLGAGDGLAWGLALGIAIGAVGAVVVIAVTYWAFFKPVRAR